MSGNPVDPGMVITGDGTDQEIEIPASFLTPGINQFTVEATKTGCTTINLDNIASIEVYSLPVGDFTFNDLCLEETANLTNTSTGNLGAGTLWEWDLTDDGTVDSNDEHPT